MNPLHSLASWLSTSGPTAAIEIAADRVSAVQVGAGRQTIDVVGHATELLPQGVVQPAVTASNVIDRAAVAAAVRAVLDRLPRRPVRVGLVVPDSAAKVSLVRFENAPTRDADLEPMIRWQIRKAVPFPLDEARVSYSPGTRLDGGGREYLVAVMRRDIVQDYEGLCTDAELQPGVVDLATFSLVNAALTGRPVDQGEDWLLVHVAAGYHSIGIVRDGALVFFRNRVATGAGDLSNLVHQTAMYYEDRLGGDGIVRVLLASSDGAATDHLTRTLVERLGAPVGTVSANAGVRDAVSETALTAVAAPIGLLLRAPTLAA